MSVSAVRVRFRAPAAGLGGLVSTYYFTSVEPRVPPVEDFLHPEWANLRVTLSGGWRAAFGSDEPTPVPAALATGPTSAATRIVSGGAESVGVGLFPLGWARLVGRAASHHADRAVALEEVLGEDAGRLVAALRGCAPGDDAAAADAVDRVLLRRLAAAPEVPDAALILRLHSLLIDPDARTVAGLAAAVGLSERHLNRLCRRRFGFPPKLLLRRQRFLRTLARLKEAPAARRVGLIDDAYVDQAHFNRDFLRFMRMTPTAYFERQRVILTQAAKLRAAAFGAPLQGLQAPPPSAPSRGGGPTA